MGEFLTDLLIVIVFCSIVFFILFICAWAVKGEEVYKDVALDFALPLAISFSLLAYSKK